MSRANEPAYPGYMLPEHNRPPAGLTTREHFAAMCLQGLLAGDGRNGDTWENGRAEKYAVVLADNLIAELSKVQP